MWSLPWGVVMWVVGTILLPSILSLIHQIKKYLLKLRHLPIIMSSFILEDNERKIWSFYIRICDSIVKMHSIIVGVFWGVLKWTKCCLMQEEEELQSPEEAGVNRAFVHKTSYLMHLCEWPCSCPWGRWVWANLVAYDISLFFMPTYSC